MAKVAIVSSRVLQTLGRWDPRFVLPVVEEAESRGVDQGDSAAMKQIAEDVYREQNRPHTKNPFYRRIA